MHMKALKFLTFLFVLAAVLPACTDEPNDLYDEDDNVAEYGFVKACTAKEPGLIYIDATDYTLWTYVDLSTRTVRAIPVGEAAPENWDFAVHRYDAKTNDGKVVETPLTDISQARGWRNTVGLPEVADTWTTDKIVIDMSTMAQGYLTYAPSYYNSTLSGWLTLDTSSMPPVYTLSPRVFVLLLPDGSRAALKLENFIDAVGVKGYMSIEYIYPL